MEVTVGERVGSVSQRDNMNRLIHTTDKGFTRICIPYPGVHNPKVFVW